VQSVQRLVAGHVSAVLRPDAPTVELHVPGRLLRRVLVRQRVVVRVSAVRLQVQRVRGDSDSVHAVQLEYQVTLFVVASAVSFCCVCVVYCRKKISFFMRQCTTKSSGKIILLTRLTNHHQLNQKPEQQLCVQQRVLRVSVWRGDVPEVRSAVRHVRRIVELLSHLQRNTQLDPYAATAQ
jgi:hypothetical protein